MRRIYVPTIEDLNRALRCSGVPVAEWGIGPTKTLDCLFTEIRNGETVLLYAGGYLIRYVRQAQARIFCTVNGQQRYLVEREQVFANGARRTRSPKVSVSEKLMRGETHLEAMIRGIQSELGLAGFSGEGLEFIGSSQKRKKKSKSYPGLPSCHRRFRYVLELPPSSVQDDGYVERTPEKTSYFEWTSTLPKVQAA